MRLLASMLTVVIPLGALSATAQLVFVPGFLPIFLNILGAIGILAVAYALNRSGRYIPAVLLTVAVPCVASLASAAINPADAMALCYVLLGVLLGGVFLPMRGVVLVAVFNVAGLLLLPVLTSGWTYPALLAPLSVNVTLPLVILVAMRHRDMIETDRQAELRDSEKRYRRLVETMNDGLAAIDENQVFRFVNDRFCRMLGYERDELLGKSVLDVLRESDRDDFVSRVEARRHGKQDPYEQIFPRKDGKHIVTLVSPSAVFDSAGRFEGSFAVITDITAHKRVELTLRESEARYRALAQAVPDALFLLDADGVHKDYIPAAGFETLVPPDAFLGKSIKEVLPSEVARASMVFVRRALATGEPQAYEYGLQIGDEVRQFEARLVPYGQNDVLAVIRDVTERYQLEAALSESEERYRSLVEDQSDLICQFDPDLTLTYVNRAYAAYFGRSVPELIGFNFLNLIPEKNHPAIREQFRTLGPGRPMVQWEHEVVTPDGEIRWQEWTDRAFTDGKGNVVRFQSIGRDVTERKRAEEALRESEARLNEAQRIAHIGSWEFDLTSQTLSWSDEMYRLHGATREGVTGDVRRYGESVLHPEDREAVLASVARAVEEGGRSQQQYRIRYGDGTVREMLGRAARIDDAAGRPLRLVGTVQDITERRQAEKRYRDLFEKAPSMYVICEDRDGVPYVIDCNNLFLETLGYHRKEVVEQSLADFYTPASREKMMKGGFQLALSREVVALERQLLTRDGRVIDTLLHTVPESDEGGCVWGTRAVYVNITDRKRAEEELLVAKERLRHLLSANPAVIYSAKVSGDYATTFVSENVTEQLGYAPKDFIEDPGFWVRNIHPEDKSYVLDGLPDVEKPGQHAKEYRFQRQDGTYRWMHDEFKLIRDAGGEPLEVVGYWTDITERKRVEQEVRLLAKTLQHVQEAVTVTDTDDTIIFVNQSFVKIYGYEREEVLGRPITMLRDPDHPPEEQPRLAMQDREDTWRGEMWNRRKDGSAFLVSVSTAVVPGEDGKPAAFIGLATDITERKRLEKQLLFQASVLESVSDAIISTDQDFNILTWNDAAEALYGWQSADVLGKPIGDILPTKYLHIRREEVIEHFSRNGEWRGEVIQSRKDGAALDVLSSVTLLKNQAGQVVGAVTANRDITERKRLEKEILQISDREQRRIGRDLHDGLGQELSGARFSLSALEQQLAKKNLAEAAQAAEISRIVREALAKTRALILGLRPIDLESGGLSQALKDLASSLERIYHVPCVLQLPDPDFVEDLDVATHLYRIAQEALNNAMKHSQATRLEVTLTRQGDAALLTVQDDGVGITPGEPTKGLGLNIMRYRAGMIRGVIDVGRAPEGGTVVACRFPLDAA